MPISNAKKAIVTGGAGFIGSHLVDELLEKGYHVTCIDNLSTGSAENILHLNNQKSFEFVEGSITDIALLTKVFPGTDYVFHQAAIPSVPRSIANPVATNEANITGTLNVLTAAKDCQVRKVICASSSSVYGNTPTLPKVETMVPSPLSPYAISKYTGEQYGKVFGLVYGFPVVSLRYFNVYGPRQSAKSEYAAVIPKFIARIQRNEPPIIFGDGTQTRDFTFVKDAVQANIKAAESDAVGVYNVGTGSRISLNELVEVLLELLGKPEIKPAYTDTRKGDVKDSLADISLAKTFGYQPEYNIRKGLEEILKTVN